MAEQIDISNTIFECIENNKSFVVTGGAGSGKTELLKQILQQTKINFNNKKIICITHTNVAVNEIKKRINNTYTVSTIHSFCQSIISNYKINLKENLIDIFKIPTIEDYAKERGLETLTYDAYKKSFEKYWKKNWFVNKVKTKNIIGKREFDNNPIENINKLNKNIRELNDKIEERIKNECDYRKIKYNETKYDNIKNFSYGHDSLLLLFVNLLKKYPMLQKILKDTYDIIFIDEYQDTNKEIIDVLINYFVDDKHIIGLFGDHMQSIYNDGIGNVDKYIEAGVLQNIAKRDNFRCSKEVITLLNSIRDDLNQELALTKKQKESDRYGSVNIYYKIIDFIPKDNKEKYFNIVDDCIETINKNSNSKVLLLSNQALAKKLKFEMLYNTFSNGINDAKEEINAEMIKMQWIDAVEMYYYYTEKKFNILIQLLKKNNYVIMSYTDKLKINNVFEKIGPKSSLKDVMDLLYANSFLKKSDSRDKECDFLSSYIAECNQNNEYLKFKNLYLEYNTYTKMNNFNQIDKEDFYSFENDMNKEEMYSKIISEELRFGEIINYYNFINERENYVTMHKTKGSSIDNVIVVMENFFWSQYNFDKLISNDKDSSVYENTKKLFYVSCSRTRKRLSLLKLVNESQIKNLRDYFNGFNLINLDSEELITDVM